MITGAQLFFRPDGTVSGVTIQEAVTYTGSDGKERVVNDARAGKLDEITEHIGKAAAEQAATHQALEDKIAQMQKDHEQALIDQAAKLQEEHIKAQADTENQWRDKVDAAVSGAEGFKKMMGDELQRRDDTITALNAHLDESVAASGKRDFAIRAALGAIGERLVTPVNAALQELNKIAGELANATLSPQKDKP